MSTQGLRVDELRHRIKAARRDMNDAEHLHQTRSATGAINRAYFAVYHATLAGFLIVAPGLDQNHGTVKGQFHFIDNDDRFPVTESDREFVAELQTARREADYEPEKERTAEPYIENARELVDSIIVGCNEALVENGESQM